MTTLQGRLIFYSCYDRVFGRVECVSGGREESSSPPRILEQAGGCRVVSSVVGETDKGASFSGKSKSSVCLLDTHLETVCREYNVCEWELSKMEKC